MYKSMKEFFKRLWAGWMKFAHVIGVFNTKLILMVMYYTLLFPFGILVRFFQDPLKMKNKPASSGWHERTTRDKTLDDLAKQS